MASVNKVILIGNLTRDPELRYTPRGAAVCEMGLAVNRKYKLDDGTAREEVTFLDVTFWGKQAETIAKYVKKGQPLYIEGRLQMDTWDDKASGQKRSKIKIIGEEFQFLASGDGSKRGTASNEAPTDSRASLPAAPPADDIPMDDDHGPF